jgi:UDP-N-acetylmuramoyl-L-alanyl-D-glutamate--2,6-diaminopimelate ligase
MLLREALEHIPGINPKGNLDAPLRGISHDSRLVEKGYLFVAIKGEKADGAHFVKQAVDRGAVAVASEKPIRSEQQIPNIVVPNARIFLAEVSRIFYEDPASKLKLVGITGTNGKTTTAWLMESIYRHAELHSCLAGTLGMQIGPRIFPSERTTPEASDLMRFLYQALKEGCTHGVMEVSSHSLALKRVFGTKFIVGVFMNLTRDHLDFHKDMETYFQAKKLFFSSENRNGIESAVINTDDPFGKRLENEVDCPVMRFGFRKPAEIRVLEYKSRTDGMDLDLGTPEGPIRLHSDLIGHPNAYNIMAATGSALCLGIEIEKIQRGIEALKNVPGRLELVDAGQDFTVIVDYAHSPDALENLLKTVSRLPHARVITVFGCGGDRDRTKRPIMGKIAINLSDLVLATSDNPRSEDPLDILAEIEPGLKSGSAQYEIIPDRQRAIHRAISIAHKGDIVVIAGKGHEDYQIIGNRVIPFDDRKQARELIEKRLELDKRNGDGPSKSFQVH